MFRITLTNGTDVAMVDKVNYIRFNSCGSFCPAQDEVEAIGVAVNGTPYNLFGHNDIKDAETVVVSFVDAGVFAKLTAQNAANIDYLSAMSGIDLPNEEEEVVEEPQTNEEEAE